MKFTIKHGNIAAICAINSEDGLCEVVYLEEFKPLDDSLSLIKFNTLPASVQLFVKNQFNCVFMRDLADRGAFVESLPIVDIYY